MHIEKCVISCFLFFLLFKAGNLLGQPGDCNCREQLKYLQYQIENKHPGFKANVKEIGLQQYQTSLEKIWEQVSSDTLAEETCIRHLNQYLGLIKDKHLKIYKPSPETKSFDRGIDKMRFEVLNPKTLYVKLPTFYKSYWREIDAFYDTLVPQLSQYPQVILDLRNNGGGGERMYLELLKNLRKSQPNPQKIAILMNGGCASACEQFILRLAHREERVQTFGQNTYGALAYGMVIAKKTPACGYIFRIPSRKYPKYADYEVEGIPPQVVLDSREDWVELVLKRWEE